MNDLDKAVSNITKHMEKGGILLTLNYIENKHFFAYRKHFMTASRWKECFLDSFELTPFHYDSGVYSKSYSRYMDILTFEDIPMKLAYSKKEAIKFY